MLWVRPANCNYTACISLAWGSALQARLSRLQKTVRVPANLGEDWALKALAGLRPSVLELKANQTLPCPQDVTVTWHRRIALGIYQYPLFHLERAKNDRCNFQSC